MEKLLLGAHLSISNGLDKAIHNAQLIGCNALQIFTHSNRQWAIKEIKAEDVVNFKKAKQETGITEIVCHSSYLINLGAENSETEEKSINCLIKELEICDQLEIKYLVMHPGTGKNINECLKQISKNINFVLKNYKGSTKLLIENTAGQGNNVGYKFEQLAYLLNNIEHNVGICFDTCHAWAAEYDFSNKKKYQIMLEEFDKIVGLKKLKTFHLNDSLKPLGSKVDRHSNIGEGTIGLEAFKLIINDKQFQNIPKIIETPKSDGDSLDQDIKNLNVLRNLI